MPTMGLSFGAKNNEVLHDMHFCMLSNDTGLISAGGIKVMACVTQAVSFEDFNPCGLDSDVTRQIALQHLYDSCYSHPISILRQRVSHTWVAAP
ncbi:MAG: hypothetical protein A4E19_08155 [Nitrospira sp. SG-bin1]|nr:MAG: hypothetical protein A4E19_08155 [Nitrospira sp. SG-bin1]